VASCRGQYRVWELGVLPTAEGARGQGLLAVSLLGQWVSQAGAAPVQHVGGETEEHRAGERVIAWVQGCKRAQHLEDCRAADEGADRSPTPHATGHE